MRRWACAILVVACSSCAPAKNASADVRLIDGTSIRLSELPTVQTIPVSGGLVYVLGVPIALDNRIKLTVTPDAPEPPCDIYLTHVTRIGPSPNGPQAAEYVIAADSACHLKAKTKYASSLGQVETGDDAALLRP